MYRKKVVQRGEKHSEIDVEKPSANRFASLADSDVQFKHTDSYGKIFDYLHEKGMMKVATQSPIKEVPAKPRQKNFEKAHKTKTKKKSTQTAEKDNDKLEDTSTKKKPDKPTQTKVIPNAKGNDKKIQSLKEKIAKLQSQFDTAAAVMRKFNILFMYLFRCIVAVESCYININYGDQLLNIFHSKVCIKNFTLLFQIFPWKNSGTMSSGTLTLFCFGI
ncbi:Hypothetical_protein [Hexamita inflata]|uniref:Hypothetical_protein n=1 Tax=Hexamita inflata TaxID=28002 RepID=A0AA86R019_9EUKA|nr:Hypothetical protein HINF_LOCUS50798 [Hexamita inflata]